MKDPKVVLPAFFAACLLIFSACKKDKDVIAAAPPANTGGGGTTTSTQSIKDSVLLLTRDIYLWNNQVPSNFAVQNYADPAAIMSAIHPYSMEPGFASAVDKWSFAMKKTEWDEYSSGTSHIGAMSAAGDFGLTVFFRAEGDLRVRLVEPNSPAGQAGVERSWRIISINGNTNMTTGNSNFIINATYSSPTGTFVFQKPSGGNVTLNLTAVSYAQKPVYLDSVYHVNGKTIGYLVFNSFLGNINNTNAEFQRVFSRFAAAQVTDVVVDLRYNGGGYVLLAEQLSNYLVSSSANGNLMMKQLYNSQNTANNEITNFRKAGSVNLSDIYFIVGRGTASASELVINNLKPHMQVKLIGSTPTHGKPVGYFAIPVSDWYIFPVSFRTVNSNGEGNYFNGIPVTAQVADGLDKDWGDVNEASLASAIRNITTGNYFGFAPENNAESVSVKLGNDKLEQPLLKITVENRKRF